MGSPELLLQLAGLAALMGFSAFFSGTETAFSALGKTQIQRIRTDGRFGSKYIAAFQDNPRRFFITVLFGNILVNIAFVSVTGSLIWLIYPFRKMLQLLTDAVLPLLGIHGAEERHRVTGAELRSFVRVASSSLTAIMFSLVFAVSLFFIAFFAGSETALVSASRELIDHGAESGDHRAVVVRDLLAQPERFLATTMAE